MKPSALKLTIGLLSGGLLAGCGGDPKTGTIPVSESPYDPFTGILATADIQAITAKFLDAPVSGLHYQSPSKEGITGIGGGFYCNSGEVTDFKIGDLLLGSAICQGVVTPQTLTAVVEPKVVIATNTITSVSGTQSTTGKTVQNTVVESYSPTDAPGINRVRLLMSLDDDQDPTNGINLPNDLTAINTTYIDFANSSTFESAATPVINALYSGEAASRLQAASETAASNHFQAQLEQMSQTDKTNYDKATGAYIDKVKVAASQASLNAAASNSGYGDDD